MLQPGVEHRPTESDYSRLADTFCRRGWMADLTVLVVGAGALGNEVIKNLALLGVGRLAVVDRDHLEASNFTRAVLFCTPEIRQSLASGLPKARLAAQRVREINPDVRAAWVNEDIADMGLSRLRPFDIVFSCVDNEFARLHLSRACLRLDKLLVDGGLGVLNYSDGMVSVFPGRSGPCYACRKGDRRRAELLGGLYGREEPCWLRERGAESDSVVRDHTDSFIATTPLMASMLAGLQVEVGLRRLQSGGLPDTGRAYRVRTHPSAEITTLDFERSPGCPLHEAIAEIEWILTPDRTDLCPEDLLALAGRPCYLALDFPIVVVARCGDCGREFNPMRSRMRLPGSACPNCRGQAVHPVLVLTRIDPETQWARLTLRELGLPRRHIHELVPMEGGRRRIYLEVGESRTETNTGKTDTRTSEEIRGAWF